MRISAWIITVAIASAGATPPPLAAQEVNSPNTLRLAEGNASPPATIDALAWLAGYWRGDGLGGVSEELWGQPYAGTLYGTYVLYKEGKPVFSEAMVLAEEGNSVVLKVRHFTPEFIAWEEKDDYVTFPLVRLGDNEAYFNGLTFRRQGDTLSIYLVLSSGGERTEHEFQLRRVAL